jgi:hypothetical protein
MTRSSSVKHYKKDPVYTTVSKTATSALIAGAKAAYSLKGGSKEAAREFGRDLYRTANDHFDKTASKRSGGSR